MSGSASYDSGYDSGATAPTAIGEGDRVGVYPQLARFRRLYVTRDARRYDATERGTAFFSRLPVYDAEDASSIREEHRNADTIFVTTSRGRTLTRCPGSRGRICCNYLTIDAYLGCTLGCRYCIMRSYLNFSPLTVQVDTDRTIASLRSIALRHPDHMVRVGTGEVGDSLLLDPAFELSREFIVGVSDLANVWFEMKTKTSFVDHLLDVDPKGNAIVAFSVNPPAVVADEEGVSAPVADRFAAARRARSAGYAVAFHFDPVLRPPAADASAPGVPPAAMRDRPAGWGYDEVVEAIGSFSRSFAEDRIAWISLGTLRYPKGHEEFISDMPALLDEFVLSADGKYRYLHRDRVEVYRYLLGRLRGVTDAPIYMCMESASMWRSVYGALPLRIPRLRPLFRRIPEV